MVAVRAVAQNEQLEWRRLLDDWQQAFEHYEVTCSSEGPTELSPEQTIRELINVKQEIGRLIAETEALLH
jgi:hypothetical protein